MPIAPDKLTSLQEAFCRHLVADPERNATRAAIAAGCIEKSASVTASRWLKSAKVQAKVQALEAKALADSEGLPDNAPPAVRASTLDEAAARVVDELKALAFSDVTDCFQWAEDDTLVLADLKGLDAAKRRAISSIRVRTTRRKEKDGDTTTETTTELKLWDKTAALRMLGQYHRLFVEVVETRSTVDEAIRELVDEKEVA